MTLSIIIIGDEILLGQVTDTNSGEIARTLGPQGWEVATTQVVGDSAEAITAAVLRAMDASDLVITTGGLGPTKDDITKHVLAKIFGGEMREDHEVLENVKRVFAKRNLQLNKLTCSQAMVPSSCRVIQNRYGTAPVMWFERDGKVLVSMPGVPFEAVGMLHDVIADEVARRFSPDKTYLHHTLIASGLPESALAEKLESYEASLPANMHLAYLPQPGYIRLRLDGTFAASDCDASRVFDEQLQALKADLGSLLLYDGDATVAEILLQRLRTHGYTVASAESCTGGNIAHAITSIAGSSDSFLGSVVSYSNSVKSGVLGVSQQNLDQYGAVSEQVVRQMAEGARRVIGADCAMATSGIAGPGGATEGKPVGTVWMAVSTPSGTVAEVKHLPGNRGRVIDRATTEVMLMLIRALDQI